MSCFSVFDEAGLEEEDDQILSFPDKEILRYEIKGEGIWFNYSKYKTKLKSLFSNHFKATELDC